MINSISCEKVKEDTLWLPVNSGSERISYSVFMKNEMNFLKIFRNKLVLIVCFWLDSLRISWYLKSNALSSSKSYLETVKLIKKKRKGMFCEQFCFNNVYKFGIPGRDNPSFNYWKDLNSLQIRDPLSRDKTGFLEFFSSHFLAK